MQEREPSRTALGAAKHRAAHQLLEQGRIFSDPLAVRILGLDPGAIAEEARADPSRRGLRLFIAARAEFTEAALKAAVEQRGVRQLVVLGAGLDTFAYRNPFAALKVFEVDHPATQAWKRRRLLEAGIDIPSALAFAPVDFEREDLMERLRAVGFDPGARAYFSWLGVAPYLTRRSVLETLRAIGGSPGGGEVVFDYSDPPETLDPERLAAHGRLAERVAAAGEPLLTHFEQDELAGELRLLGFSELEDLGPAGLLGRYLGPGRTSAIQDRGGHVIHAATPVLGR
jgi:methyltransferase (TIGR00027 family)